MPDKRFIDIKVVGGGWDIDAGQQPEQCSDLYSIAQDIKHAIMENGLARKMAAERHRILRADILLQIEQQAEADTRVVPGSATAAETEAGHVLLTAYAYGYDEPINTEVTS